MTNRSPALEVRVSDVVRRTTADGHDNQDAVINSIKGSIFTVTKVAPRTVEMHRAASEMQVPRDYLTSPYVMDVTGSILQPKKGDMFRRTIENSSDIAFDSIEGEVFTVKEVKERHIILEISPMHVSVPIQYVREGLFEILKRKN